MPSYNLSVKADVDIEHVLVKYLKVKEDNNIKEDIKPTKYILE